MTGHRLTLARAALEGVRRHAADAYPEECCGFLMGRERPGGGMIVERAVPADNEHPGARSRRYLIPPERVLAARREARDLDLDVVGYYHSHPDRSAEPSRRDLEDAWPAVSYLIVPVESGVPGRSRSWRLGDDGWGFQEEAIGAVDGDAPEEGARPRAADSRPTAGGGTPR